MASLAHDISSAMAEISNDKEIFANFEIDSTFGKYQCTDGNTKIFDYWYNRFSEMSDQLRTIQDSVYQEMINEIKRELQKLFSNCYSCYTKLNQLFQSYPNYTLAMVRANIDISSEATVLIVLYKTNNNVSPEDFDDYIQFQKAIYDVQEQCNTNFESQNFSISNLHWDDTISVDCIKRDFPICIRN